jgi:hypothetical protein
MPPDVNVATDPLIVYGMVAMFGSAILLALVFVWPRRGLGAVKRSEVPDHMGGDLPWMPGGDVFGREPQPEPEAAAADDPWAAADLWGVAPPVAPPAAPPPVDAQPPPRDPWSTGATGQPAPQPRWDKPESG